MNKILISFALLSILSYTSAINCEANYYYDGSICTHCLNGRVSPPGDLTPITACKCPAGTFGDDNGFHVCTPCSKNQYSDVGSIVCIDCLYSRQSSSGSTRIQACQCPVGQYGSNDGISPCFPCPQDRISPIGSTDIADCQCLPGTIGAEDGVTICENCPINHFSNESTTCIPCPNNRVSNPKSQITDCSCPAGTKGPNNGTSPCQPCPINTWSYQRSTACTSCVFNRVTLAAPVFQSSITDCKCPLGTYGPSDGMSECTPCPPNTWASYGFTTCTACINGRVTAGTNQSGLIDCQCPEGTYGLLDGVSSCTPCPSNSSSKQNSTICTCNKTGNDDSTEINQCNCPAGFIVSLKDGVYTCIACPFNTWSAKGSTKCTPCTYSRVTGVSQATINDCQCPAGTFGPSDGISPCSACQSKSWSSQGSTFCSICANGRITETSQTSVNDCLCPKGYIGDADGKGECIAETTTSSSLKQFCIFISIFMFIFTI